MKYVLDFDQLLSGQGAKTKLGNGSDILPVQISLRLADGLVPVLQSERFLIGIESGEPLSFLSVRIREK